jgi:hypothetical protein
MSLILSCAAWLNSPSFGSRPLKLTFGARHGLKRIYPFVVMDTDVAEVTKQ